MKKLCLLVLSFSLAALLSVAIHGTAFAGLKPSQPGFPNKNLLVSAASLQDSIGQKNLVIIDARTSGYDTSHIPGAINIKHEDYWTWGKGLLPRADLNSKLSAAGLKRGMNFVIYDNTSASWGAAGRIFWMLEYLGCSNVHLLDGGWDKWVADGRPTEATINILPTNTFKAAIQSFRKATKGQIKKRLSDEYYAVIDSRTDEEFIGWQLYGEARGGHIPGAVHIPYAWFFNSDKTVLNYSDLKTLFTSRGITKDKTVTAYCTVGIRSGFVYFLLRLMGYPSVSNYDASIAEWAAQSSLPMDKLPNYQALVSAQWVKDLIDGKNPPTYPGNGYVILYPDWYARYYEDRTDYVGTPYEDGHIPGAIFVDIYSLENGPDSEYGEGYKYPSEANIKPIPQLQQSLGNMGITKDSTVVVYTDKKQGMSTGLRTAWALLIAGVDDVRFLNGGYEAWLEIGGEVDTVPHPWVPVSFGIDVGNSQYVASLYDVRDVIVNGTDPDIVIADDRSWEEYIGIKNTYHYFSALGRLATAQWIGNGNELVRSDKVSLRTYTDVLYTWKQRGFTAEKKMYCYCGTGWRSSMYTFYAYLVGWPAANFDGGWYEWSWYPENPVETGTP